VDFAAKGVGQPKADVAEKHDEDVRRALRRI
jgi:hypothetical protein